MLNRIARRLYAHSPRENVAFLRKRFSPPVIRRNDMLDELMALESFPRILQWCMRRIGGYAEVIVVDALPTDPKPTTAYVLCTAPGTEAEWNALAAVRAPNVYLLSEVVGPFTQIPFLMRKLGYFFKTPDEIMPFYLGEDFFGPLKELDEAYPLRGKRVIEFGPFDGCQTLGLAHLGAEVTAIDARAENITKTRAVLDATGMHATLRMDDFHNVSATRYGRYDLAFAHGVYYHSIAPFLFLENLISLADNIFVGGFCATDALPLGPWQTLRHGAQIFRVKPYGEGVDYSAGINAFGYYFHGDDLMAFFAVRGFAIDVISDEAETVTAGQYLRLLARRH